MGSKSYFAAVIVFSQLLFQIIVSHMVRLIRYFYNHELQGRYYTFSLVKIFGS